MMKILAVDDDHVFLSILDQALRLSGYSDLELLSSPISALLMVESSSQTFDCILLDIEMPVMTGIELCARIRAIEAYKNTPIVMITTRSDRQSIDRAFNNGATDYITKPLDSLELKARLGSIKRLVQEQNRLKLMEYQFTQQSAAASLEFDFYTPIMVPEFGRGIEFHALQNYLLTIGLKGLFSVAAVAISIENASVLYMMATKVAFRSMLSDVASVIEDSLKTERLLISYAGSGNFVGILIGQSDWNATDLEIEMNDKMEEANAIYLSDRLPLPKIRVSPVVSNSLFSPKSPSRILDRAIASVGGNKKAMCATVA